MHRHFGLTQYLTVLKNSTATKRV